MTAVRRTYTNAEELSLLSQVDRVCPECGRQLFYKKSRGTYKRYELAHIYPLNPTKEEIEVLKDEEKLHDDVNDPDNIIPLCVGCHTEFDKPRTVEDYRRLAARKRACIRYSEQQEIQASYRIESEISKVIDSLYAAELEGDGDILEYDPKSLDQKMKGSMPFPLIRKIKHNVTDYYQHIKNKFVEIESESPNASVLIYAQIRTFYLQQAKLGVPQQEVFKNMVAWVCLKTKPSSTEAAEIVVSFFVQNCEVFE